MPQNMYIACPPAYLEDNMHEIVLRLRAVMCPMDHRHIKLVINDALHRVELRAPPEVLMRIQQRLCDWDFLDANDESRLIEQCGHFTQY